MIIRLFVIDYDQTLLTKKTCMYFENGWREPVSVNVNVAFQFLSITLVSLHKI